MRRGRGALVAERRAVVNRFFPELDRGIPYIDLLLPEQVEIVHGHTMDLLENHGIDFRDEEACSMWRAAGAEVDGYRVRIDRGLLMDLISTAPAEYTMIARDPERTVTLGGRKSIFTRARSQMPQQVVQK